MRVPRQVGGPRDPRGPQESDEQGQTSEVSGVTATSSAPVARARSIEGRPDRQPGGDEAMPGHVAGADGGLSIDAIGGGDPVEPTARVREPIFEALEAGAALGAGGAPLNSADVARLVARLRNGSEANMAAFAPAVDVLQRLKRLMELVEQRRSGGAVRAGAPNSNSRRVEPITGRIGPRGERGPIGRKQPT